MKVTNTEYNSRLGCWIIVCPFCETILASNTEKEMLPEFVICSCEKPAFELFNKDGNAWIRHNKYPRFIGRVTMGAKSDIEEIELLDNCTDAKELAIAMRKAAEFLSGKYK